MSAEKSILGQVDAAGEEGRTAAVRVYPFEQPAVGRPDFGLAGAFLMYAMIGPGAWSWQGWRSGGEAPAPAKAATKKPPVKRSSARAPLRAAA